MTPSMRTSVLPPTVTMINTLTSGMDAPPARRKRVWRGERLLKVNSSWKRLVLSLLIVTLTEVSASSTSCETGTGTTGPIMRVRLKPLAILHSGNVLRQSDSEAAPDRLEQFVRPDCAVGVAEPPELLGIAKILR